jgi:hypothetical protein
LKKFDLPEPLAPTAHAKQHQLVQRVLLASSGAAPCSPQAGSLTHYVDLWTERVCNELVLVAQETLDDDLQVIMNSLFRLSAKQPGWWKGPSPCLFCCCCRGCGVAGFCTCLMYMLPRVLDQPAGIHLQPLYGQLLMRGRA